MNQVDMTTLLNTLGDLVARWGLKLLGAIVLIVIGRMAAGWIRRAVRRALERGSMDPTLTPFVSSMTYWLVMIFVLLAVLNAVGVQTASMVAVLGAAGLAVGLAMQGTLSNFAAGVMLLVFRPFGKGDFIDAGGTTGTVDAIGIFSTTLNTPDNVRVIIPNSSVWGQTIRNFAANPTRRVDMVVGIGYDDNIGTAMDTVNRVLESDERVLETPAPVVVVDSLGDSSVNLAVRPWCRKEDYWALKWELTRRFKEELEAAGCSIPFPQRDVHLHQAAGV